MADPDHNQPKADPPPSIGRTRRFAESIDRHGAWGERLIARRPLVGAGIGAGLLRRFAGLGAVGAWSARLAERFGAAQSGERPGVDMPLAARPAPPGLARSRSAGAWAPQLARDLLAPPHDDPAPELARGFARDLSDHGWPVQPARALPPASPGAEPASPIYLAPAGDASARPASPAPRLSSGRPPGVAEARPRAPAELSRDVEASRALSRSASAADSAEQPVEPHAPPLSPADAAVAAPEASDARPRSTGETGASAHVQAHEGAEADERRSPPSRGSASVEPPARLGALDPAAPLSLPLVTRRPTALLRDAAPDPLARMGYVSRVDSQRSSAGLPAARISSPVEGATSAPAQTATLPAVDARSSPGVADTALPPQGRLPGIASRAAASAAPSRAPAAPQPPARAGHPLPIALAAGIARRYDGPAGGTRAPLALRTWSPGPPAARPAEREGAGHAAGTAVEFAAIGSHGHAERATEPLRAAAPATSTFRPAIAPAIPASPATAPSATDLSDSGRRPAGATPASLPAVEAARAADPAGRADWSALPLVQRALARSTLDRAGVGAEPHSLAAEIAGRQAAFIPALFASGAAPGVWPASSPDGARASADLLAPARALAAPERGDADDFGGPRAEAAGVAAPGYDAPAAPRIPALPRLIGPAGAGGRAGWTPEGRPALTLHAVARAAAPPEPIPGYSGQPGHDFGFAPPAPLLQRAPAAEQPSAALPAAPAGSAAAAPAAGGGQSIDELARKVYDYLRRELRIEQERAGWRSW